MPCSLEGVSCGVTGVFGDEVERVDMDSALLFAQWAGGLVLIIWVVTKVADMWMTKYNDLRRSY